MIITMKTLSRAVSDKLFDKWWDEMTNEWFKVEVLQDYAGEDDGPSLRNWIKGDKQTAIELIKSSDYSKWAKDCREKLAQGVKLIRIHIVEQPLTDYIEWEIEHYKLVNIPRCGESVHLLNRAKVADLSLPDGDFMIFDEKKVVLNKYDKKGSMTHQTFFEEPDDIGNFLEFRQRLVERAKPL